MQSIFSVDNKPFYVLGGQVHNSSSYNLASMNQAWKALAALHANTVEFPVYWEQVEPQEGQFTFDHLDEIIEGCRQRGLRAILLWFANWKNGSMQYAPAWVKADQARFQRVLTHSGQPLFVLSSHCLANWEADSRAFNQLMAHLKEIDGDQHTVIGIQVENEPGILGAVRDHGVQAKAEYHAPVPTPLIVALQAAEDNPITRSWRVAGAKSAGSWLELFGHQAGEYFSAWSIARYIDRLAEAGKSIYQLPLYVNVWIAENGRWLPGASYPSGGAGTPVLDLWKWATPNIDLIAPDIYVQPAGLYNRVAGAYHRPDNLLFIPESGGSLSNALNIFSAIGSHHATGYAVFGIESLLSPDGSVKPGAKAFVESFQSAANALPLIEKYLSTDVITPVVQEEFQSDQFLDFGNWSGLILFASSSANAFSDFQHHPIDPEQRGRGLIFHTAADEFYLVGAGYRLTLQPILPEHLAFSKPNADYDAAMSPYLLVEEGHFTPQGAWVSDRRRNGDEITNGLWLAPDIGVLHVVLTRV